MKKSVLFIIGLLATGSSMVAQPKQCLEQVTVNLDYITNNTDKDFWLELQGQDELIHLRKNKTQYFANDIFSKENVCSGLTQDLGTLYEDQAGKKKVGLLQLIVEKKNNTFNFTASFNGNKDSVSNFAFTNKTFNGQLSLSLDGLSADGKLKQVTISLEYQTILDTRPFIAILPTY